MVHMMPLTSRAQFGNGTALEVGDPHGALPHGHADRVGTCWSRSVEDAAGSGIDSGYRNSKELVEGCDTTSGRSSHTLLSELFHNTVPDVLSRPLDDVDADHRSPSFLGAVHLSSAAPGPLPVHVLSDAD
jgi:hypothetical protein